MIEKIKEHIAEVEAFKAKTKEEVENFRIQYLGKKGLLNQFYAELKNVSNDKKREFGQAVNGLRDGAQAKINTLKEQLESK